MNKVKMTEKYIDIPYYEGSTIEQVISLIREGAKKAGYNGEPLCSEDEITFVFERPETEKERLIREKKETDEKKIFIESYEEQIKYYQKRIDELENKT